MRLLTLLILSAVYASAEPLTLPLWPEGVPEPAGFKAEPEQDIKKEDGVRRVSHVSQPTLTVYPAQNPTGTAILVCPGGGYNILAIEHEGTQVCDYLNTIGVTGIVLKYRVPRRDNTSPHEAPLADAQRAMSLIRQHATEWKIDAQKLGILGFSAGGHLSIMTALHSPAETRPNFVVPIYPAYLLDDKAPAFTLLPNITVTKDAPPLFVIHASDDKHSAAGSALIYLEYKKLNIPAEVHFYASGGHGFGMKADGKPVNQWPQRLGEWLATLK